MSVAGSNKVICVQGPTASGKSALAERIALAVNGEIVSADSMQIYRGMDIGTAKVAPEHRHVPYHCIDIVDPGEPYSAALFQHDARTAIAQIEERGAIPVLCGGTGFYVRAVLDDMDFAPGDQESQLREEYTALAQELGAEGLHAYLAALDPESAAQIHPHNVKRVVRALEMHAQGESYAERKDAFKRIPSYLDSVKIALDVERSMLYERIDARVDEMVRAGLVEEVKLLLDRGFREGLTAPQAIGYKEMVSYLDGMSTMDEAIGSIKQSTRHYAKRQLSWLRGDPDIIWLRADDGITDTLVEQALEIMERHGIHEV